MAAATSATKDHRSDRRQAAIAYPITRTGKTPSVRWTSAGCTVTRRTRYMPESSLHHDHPAHGGVNRADIRIRAGLVKAVRPRRAGLDISRFPAVVVGGRRVNDVVVVGPADGRTRFHRHARWSELVVLHCDFDCLAGRNLLHGGAGRLGRRLEDGPPARQPLEGNIEREPDAKFGGAAALALERHR